MRPNNINLKLIFLISLWENIQLAFGKSLKYFKQKTVVGHDIMMERRRLRKYLQQGYFISYNGACNLFSFSINKRMVRALLRRYTSDFEVFEQIIIGGEYQPLVDLINSKGYSEKIRLIIDAGANVGLTTLYLKCNFNHPKLFAIEPDNDNCKILERNVNVNGITNVSICKSALWYKREQLSVNRDFRDGKDWSISVSNNVFNNDHLVNSITIQDVLIESKEEFIDILKIDIEGAERFVFDERHNPDLFLSKTKFIAMEIHDEFGVRNDIEGLLIKNSFNLCHKGELVFGYNTKYIY